MVSTVKHAPKALFERSRRLRYLLLFGSGKALLEIPFVTVSRSTSKAAVRILVNLPTYFSTNFLLASNLTRWSVHPNPGL